MPTNLNVKYVCIFPHVLTYQHMIDMYYTNNTRILITYLFVHKLISLCTSVIRAVFTGL